MNEFDYVLKAQELTTLTTKKSKEAFIRALNNRKYEESNAYWDIKLAQETLHYFKDHKVTGLATLKKNINFNIGRAATEYIRTNREIDLSILDLDIPYEPYVDVWDPWFLFINSPGIPTYLKLALIRAKHEATSTKGN